VIRFTAKEPGRRSAAKPLTPGAADCSEYRQAAGAFALGSSVTPIEPIGLLAPQSDFD